jgi:hypothetical protein
LLDELVDAKKFKPRSEIKATIKFKRQKIAIFGNMLNSLFK